MLSRSGATEEITRYQFNFHIPKTGFAVGALHPFTAIPFETEKAVHSPSFDGDLNYP
jgi:hypothetical protein